MLDDEELAVILNGVRGRLGPHFASFAQSHTSLPAIEEAIKADRVAQAELIEYWAANVMARIDKHEEAARIVGDAVYELLQVLRGKKV